MYKKCTQQSDALVSDKDKSEEEKEEHEEEKLLFDDKNDWIGMTDYCTFCSFKTLIMAYFDVFVSKF